MLRRRDELQRAQPMLYWEECKCKMATIQQQKLPFCRIMANIALPLIFLTILMVTFSLAASQITAGHEFNSESVFEVAFVDKGDDNFNWGYTGEGATADGSIMRSQEYGIVWGNVVPSDKILNEFEPNDPRYKFTFYESGDKILTKGGTAAGVALTEDGMNVAQSNHNGVSQKRVYRKYSVLGLD